MYRRLGLVLVAASILIGAVIYGVCAIGTDRAGVALIPQRVTATPTQPTATASLPTRPLPSPTATTLPATPTPTPLPLGLVQVTSFRFVFETSSEGEKVQMQGVWSTTAVYVKRTTTGADGSTTEVEVYYVDGTLYVNQASGGQQSRFDARQDRVLEALGVFDFNRLLQEAQAAGELSLTPVGLAEIRGVACTKYEFLDRGSGTMSQGVLYLGRDDGLIYRLEDANGGTFLEYWDYNADVDIEPPI